jgi:hypothetical protein
MKTAALLRGVSRINIEQSFDPSSDRKGRYANDFETLILPPPPSNAVNLHLAAHSGTAGADDPNRGDHRDEYS